MEAAPGTEFDFLHGQWKVAHRRLKTRLSGADDWQEFGGQVTVWPTLGGEGNVDDNLLELPDGDYRAMSVRSFDQASGEWAIWWLDGRSPHGMDVPVIGRFEGGEGIFLAEDVFEGRPITVRFRWRNMDTPTPVWEQAFSADGGKSWEVNWTMTFHRM